MLNDAEFVAGVRFEIFVRRQSLGHVDSKRLGKPPFNVNCGEFTLLMFRMLHEFALLASKIGNFAIGLAGASRSWAMSVASRRGTRVVTAAQGCLPPCRRKGAVAAVPASSD